MMFPSGKGTGLSHFLLYNEQVCYGCMALIMVVMFSFCCTTSRCCCLATRMHVLRNHKRSFVLLGYLGHNDHGRGFWVFNFFRRHGPPPLVAPAHRRSFVGEFAARAAIDASRLQGLRGIREHDPKKLWFFYLWKLGRFCFESMLLLTDMFEAPRLLAVPAPTVVKWLELTPPPAFAADSLRLYCLLL